MLLHIQQYSFDSNVHSHIIIQKYILKVHSKSFLIINI